jgi:hypothetical protein
VVDSHGRLTSRREDLYSTNISSYKIQSLPPNQKVSQDLQEKDTYPQTEIKSARQLLQMYRSLLQDEEIDWTGAYVPKEFFIELYKQTHHHYSALVSKGVRGNTYGIWKSVESSIIRNLAEQYRVDYKIAYNFVLICTNREDQLNKSSAQVSTPQISSVDQYHGTVDSAVNEYHNYETVQVTPVDSVAEEYPMESTNQHHTVDSSSISNLASVDSSTIKSTLPAVEPDDWQIREDLLQELDLTPEDEAVGRRDDLLKLSTEELRDYVTRVKNNRQFWENIQEPETRDLQKTLRIPTLSDFEDYSTDFTNVIRKRNIYILFNNFYKNITLRNDGIRFLKTVFDKNATQDFQTKFENLFDNQTPEALFYAFIDTVLNLHEKGGDSLKSPGGYFIKRAKQFVKANADSETLQLVEKYSQMTYEEFTHEMIDIIKKGKKVRNKEYRGR